MATKQNTGHSAAIAPNGATIASHADYEAMQAERDQLAAALRELIYAHEAGEVTRDDWVKARQALAKVQQS